MSEQNTPDARYRAISRITWIGAIVNLILSAVKILFGWLGQSQALIADGIHSLSDLLSDGVVLFAARHGSYKADSKHPYGHARIETAATVVMGILLIGIAIGVLWDAMHRLLNPELLLAPGWMALVIALLSIAAKEALYHYTMRVARELRSPLLRANAWHHRTDSISTVIVLIGIGGSLLGVSWLDAVGALGVALMIGHVGGELVWKGMNELVDTGLAEEKLQEISEIIRSVEGVRTFHLLRSRLMGENALLDVHLQVAPRITVSEGHQIAVCVHERLVKQFEEIQDVMVHIDPEDDDGNEQEDVLNAGLPPRSQIRRDLDERWQDVAALPEQWRLELHYLNGRVEAEVYLPLTCESPAALTDALRERAAGLNYLRRLKIYFGD